MDRRSSPRYSMVREVLLDCQAFGIVRGVTQDISASGVFVSTRYLSLDEDSTVDVCFLGENHKANHFHKVKARVSRVESDGLGLSFTDKLSSDFLRQNNVCQ